MQNNVKLSRAYYGTDWILSLFWINLKGFEIYIKSIIGEFFSAAWLMRFQENQLKPAQISSNFNYLSEPWQSRSRIPGPKCLLAVLDASMDDPPRMTWFNFDESELFTTSLGTPVYHRPFMKVHEHFYSEQSWQMCKCKPDNAKKVKFVQDLIK